LFPQVNSEGSFQKEGIYSRRKSDKGVDLKYPLRYRAVMDTGNPSQGSAIAMARLWRDLG